MNQAALVTLRLGHVPVIGVNMAPPIIAAAECDVFDEVMMPLSRAWVEHCVALLRLGRPSQGADQEVGRFRQAAKPVFSTPADTPARVGRISLHAALACSCCNKPVRNCAVAPMPESPARASASLL